MPADTTIGATGPGGAIHIFTASATDAVDPAPSVVCVPASGSLFPLGATQVDCTATDSAGNGAQASFTVTVEDTTDPTITAPADTTIGATGPGGAVHTFAATATDTVDPAPSVVCVPASGSLFPLGATQVGCTATDSAGNGAQASFTVTVEVVNPVPSISSISQDSAEEGGPGFTLTVNGTGFVPSSVVRWDGVDLTTTFLSDSQVQATVAASDIANAGQNFTVVNVTVSNPPSGGGISNAKPFTIFESNVDTIDSEIIKDGETGGATDVPTQGGDAGADTTLTNNAGGGGDATVSVATYDTNPTTENVLSVGGMWVDIRATGVDPTDTLLSQLYHPSTVMGTDETNLVLLYFNGSTWLPVLSSGGAVPAKDTTDHLDGTVSGGRFTVLFDNTSIPKLTELTGTVFTSTVPAPETQLCNGLPATIVGTSGADVIYGTSGDDVILGLGGNDTIKGRGGNDTICAGPDDDRVYGEDGDDIIFGEEGADVVYGGDGEDKIFGGAGNDRLKGNGDNDMVFGEAGNDTLVGYGGDDMLSGGADNDRLYGGDGNDTLYGGEGDDVIYGNAGADEIWGGEGNDRLKGGGDNDRVFGGAGNDTVAGYGGDDLRRGGADNDRLYGGDGDDDMFGDAGDDVFYGGDDDDDMDGGTGTDRCKGEAGGSDTAVNCESVSGVP